jgi:hypothetical protein
VRAALRALVVRRRAACDALGEELEHARALVHDPLGIRRRVCEHPLTATGVTAAGAFVLTQALDGSGEDACRDGDTLSRFGAATLAAWGVRTGLASLLSAWLADVEPDDDGARPP